VTTLPIRFSFSVVVPAFNEEGGIVAILKRVLSVQALLAEQGLSDLEIIVVDDGSRDQTVAAVKGLMGTGASPIRLFRHTVNRGYGAALKTGFAHATGDLVAFLDADGTYPPEYFPQLCKVALSGTDLVIGSRMGSERSQMPPMRRLGNMIFANLVTVLGNNRVNDSASGMRVIRRTALPKLYPLPDGLNFTPIMSLRATHEGLSMTEVPIPYSERVGESKLSVVRDGLRYVQSIVWTTLSYNPVRVLGMFGVAGVGLALLVGIWLAVSRLSGVTTLSRWEIAAVFLALVAGVTGVSLFNLGAMFNYLVALFKREPVRAGLFGKPIFDPPLDRQFGWMGLVIGLVGVGIAVYSLALGLSGWEIGRIWLYLVGSALLILVGFQLVISWLLMRILEELAARDMQVQSDMAGAEVE
jgi:glycosyltransferase involved in cell wall biosynthesis